MFDAKTNESDYRKAVEDTVAIAAAMAPYCERVDDLVGMLNLALENDGQLKWLLKTVAGQQRR